MMLSIPVRPGSVVTVSGEFPISEAGWAHFMAVLDAMRPGLIESSADAVNSSDRVAGVDGLSGAT
jgi:hypothetical protein